MRFVYDKNNTDKNPWARAIHNIVHEQRSNWVQVTIGPPGTGKSSLNLSQALMLDKTFAIDNTRVAFSVADFINICRSFDEKRNGRGKVVMLEEVGVVASSKEWQSSSSRELSNVLQTFRSQGLILLMSVPDDELFIKDGRRLIKGLFIMKKLDFEHKTVSCQPFECQHNPRNHKTYFHYLRKKTKRGDVMVDDWTLPMAGKEDWENFETMMEAYKKSVRDRAVTRLNAETTKMTTPKRKVKCNKCNFSWAPRDQNSNVPPKCSKCFQKDTVWL